MKKIKKIQKKSKKENSTDLADPNNTQTQTNIKKQKITDPVLIAKALVNYQGNEHSTAESLGISVKTLRRHIKNNEALSDTKDHILAYQIGFAEEQLMGLIKLKDLGAIKYFLDSKGKEFGYGKGAVGDVQSQKTGVLLINNMTVNNNNLNPDDWSKNAIQMRQDQKKELDKLSFDLDLDGEND